MRVVVLFAVVLAAVYYDWPTSSSSPSVTNNPVAITEVVTEAVDPALVGPNEWLAENCKPIKPGYGEMCSAMTAKVAEYKMLKSVCAKLKNCEK